jgi:hypothetical protein
MEDQIFAVSAMSMPPAETREATRYVLWRLHTYQNRLNLSREIESFLSVNLLAKLTLLEPHPMCMTMYAKFILSHYVVSLC